MVIFIVYKHPLITPKLECVILTIIVDLSLYQIEIQKIHGKKLICFENAAQLMAVLWLSYVLQVEKKY